MQDHCLNAYRFKPLRKHFLLIDKHIRLLSLGNISGKDALIFSRRNLKHMNKKNARIQWMHNRIASGNYPNENRLAEKFGVSRRTAERDIYYMKNTLEAPIAFSTKDQGFYYSEEYNLPLSITTGNDDEYAGIKAKFTIGKVETDKTVQLQIPYIAELYIPNKLAAMELKNFIVSSKRRKGIYVCEFHSAELFLGIIMSLDAEITVLSPEWLRKKIVSSAEKMLKANEHQD